MTVDQGDAARKLADFREKLAGPLLNDRRDVTEAVALRDRNMTGQDHEHARARFACFEQPVALLVGLDLAEPAHAGDLSRRQRRKRLIMAGESALPNKNPPNGIPGRGSRL